MDREQGERREEEEEVRGIFVIRGKTRGPEKELTFSHVSYGQIKNF